MTRRALVTGAAGFVGANVVRRLAAEGLEVHALVREDGDSWRLVDAPVQVHRGSIADAAAVHATVAEVRPHWVVHAAAHGAYPDQVDVDRMVAVNVLGTFHLLDALSDVGGCVGVVHTGSSSEYGFQDHAPVESEAVQPNSAYAVTKCAATHACSLGAASRGLPACTVRLSSVYGPWEQPTRLVPRLVAEAREQRLPPLASPDTARDFVFVDDAVEGIVKALHAVADAPGAVWNLGSGEQTTIAQLVDLTCAVFDLDVSPEWHSYPDRAWDTTSWIADPGRARVELGWTVTTGLSDGLRAFSAWLDASGLVARYSTGGLAPSPGR